MNKSNNQNVRIFYLFSVIYYFLFIFIMEIAGPVTHFDVTTSRRMQKKKKKTIAPSSPFKSQRDLHLNKRVTKRKLVPLG